MPKFKYRKSKSGNFLCGFHANEHGFVALISVIIISLLLLTITVILNFSTFFGRFNVLDAEFKETSVSLAEACVNAAILEIGKGNLPTAGTIIPVGGGSCTVVSVTVAGTQDTIRTQANYKNSYTNLEVKVTPLTSTIRINAWRECKTICS